MRTGSQGVGAPGYVALELAARAFARGQRDRMFQTQFALRQSSSVWAGRRREVREAGRIYAPSLSARRLFVRNDDAEKILLLDLPVFRVMHEDLDKAASTHPTCGFLNRYRAPAWALVEQEVEIAMADRIIVRGRFAKRELAQLGASEDTISIAPLPVPPIESCIKPESGKLRILLAGLAAARHGTVELLSVLKDRPWLRVALRSGEGAEPQALLQHPQVCLASEMTLSQVDAVISPSLCETYLPQVHIAAASGIPVIATLRGAGSVPQNLLAAEISGDVERGLARALDALYQS